MDNLRRFVVVFTLFFFLAASVCGYILALSYDGTTDGKKEVLTVGADKYDPYGGGSAKNIFCNNILFIVGERNRPETELLLVMNYDSSAAAMTFLYIPKDIAYNTDQSVTTMGRTFAEASRRSQEPAGAATALLISSYLNIGIPYYINLDDTAFKQFINYFGAVQFDIPADLAYRDSYYRISLPKGTQNLDGTGALQLIQFYKTADGIYSSEMLKYYDGTDQKRIAAAQNYLEAFLNQKLTKENSNRYYAENFKSLIQGFLDNARCDHNLPDEMLDIIAESIAELSGNQIQYYMFTEEKTQSDDDYIVTDLLLDSAVANTQFHKIADRFQSVTD